MINEVWPTCQARARSSLRNFTRGRILAPVSRRGRKSGGNVMSVKQVLVSYGDRRKVLKIIPNSELTDVEVLTKSFRTEFKFKANVDVVITFQRFDPYWDETIDLEKESVINNKDKLIAVVTPLLVAPFSSPSGSCVEKVSIPCVTHVAVCFV